MLQLIDSQCLPKVHSTELSKFLICICITIPIFNTIFMARCIQSGLNYIILQDMARMRSSFQTVKLTILTLSLHTNIIQDFPLCISLHAWPCWACPIALLCMTPLASLIVLSTLWLPPWTPQPPWPHTIKKVFPFSYIYHPLRHHHPENGEQEELEKGRVLPCKGNLGDSWPH